MYKTTGIIRYSPKLLGDKENSPNWWVVVDVDPEIGKYYRWLFFRDQYRRIKRPAWEAHISVVRNEPPISTCLHLWQKYDGQPVEIEYSNEADTNWEEVWLPVRCDFLLDLRVELGLPREPFYPLHLTFGNFKF